MENNSITLKQAMVNGGLVVGFAEVRRFVDAGAVCINGTQATDADQPVFLGDKIQLGKKGCIVTKI